VKALTNYITALTDFLEAELNAFRVKLVKTVIATAIVLCAGAFALWGVGLFMAALFLFVMFYLGPTLAAVITGGAALVIAAVVAGIGLWLAR